MFTSPFPEHVSFVARSEIAEHEELFPEERATLSENVAKKRYEQFLLGRLAAREALQNLGQTPQAIARRENGSPIWPEGILGSITHTDGWALAALSSSKDTIGIGIDLENLERPIKTDIARKVCRPSELEWINAEATKHKERLISLFSAKESIFKALFPATGEFFGFQDAELRWEPEKSMFEATLKKQLSTEIQEGFSLRVRIDLSENYLLSSTLVVR